MVTDNKNPTKVGQLVVFTATVTAKAGVPTGTVQFMVDGRKAGVPIRLNGKGQAMWRTESLKPGRHEVAARYIPSPGSAFEPSTSPDKEHTVKGHGEDE